MSTLPAVLFLAKHPGKSAGRGLLKRPDKVSKRALIIALSRLPEPGPTVELTGEAEYREQLVEWLFKLNRGEQLALFHCVACFKVYEQAANHQCFCGPICKHRMKIRRLRLRKKSKAA